MWKAVKTEAEKTRVAKKRKKEEAREEVGKK